MESILLVIHVIIALAVVGLIMLQQGKGAEMGASFGAGASQTVFGAAGSGNFFSRMTALLVAVFFATSLFLAMLSKERGGVDVSPAPVLETTTEQSAPASDIPAAEQAPASEVPSGSAAQEESDIPSGD